mmetsp:Transcript_29125/g.68628  ORF Transcript_29125/g.68628 Transcript_29125/m.68628 type:complete len:93 (+) Transcript_29125:25-303(+)|eukprot:CAMPEP_0175804592 /NCGR_PEP_ID=MMETSP0107_2-20121207/200_1 /TAXON_ID=195067 ORGANISM="Goniomonas pacifica, Strain CCMP1869" /NCGR_SAMPLE_ID=MMETSP0107_2 /ASSEMBLY_ACC=CAM_ASM_000203 /LENGTH=92 /DNA_ID=CAMNT_0017115947 /DNA_START=25 /DNA_END=303 /DNA_ORIENTATION=+
MWWSKKEPLPEASISDNCHKELHTSVSSATRQEKLDELHGLEKDLTELHTLFQDVAILVNAQQEDLDLVETHVERAMKNVSAGTHELAAANK